MREKATRDKRHLNLLGYWQIMMSQIETCFYWSMIQFWLNLFPSWRPHVITQNNELRVGIGGGAPPPKNQFRFTPQYASCLAKFWPDYVIFHYPISGLIQRSIPNFKPCRFLQSSPKTWWEQLPKKVLLGCVLLKVYFLTGDLFPRGGGGGGTAIYGLYRYVLLWRVWFSSSSLWDRVYKSANLGQE